MNTTVKNTKSMSLWQILKAALSEMEDWVVVLGLTLLAVGMLRVGWSVVSPGALFVWAVAGVGLSERSRVRRGRQTRGGEGVARG
ncbi:hypothetical protein [Streptomyces sp. NPDC004435]|uniref:hypothetical protein n=1 Tax=Streptomyces sp. NPDC004435 TaxID=3364701 RepID=UPI0036A41A76